MYVFRRPADVQKTTAMRVVLRLPAAAPATGRIMSSLARHGGLVGSGGIAGRGGGLAG